MIISGDSVINVSHRFLTWVHAGTPGGENLANLVVFRHLKLMSKKFVTNENRNSDQFKGEKRGKARVSCKVISLVGADPFAGIFSIKV